MSVHMAPYHAELLTELCMLQWPGARMAWHPAALSTT